MKDRGFRRARERLSMRFGVVAPTEPAQTIDLSHRGLCFECDELPRNHEMVVHLVTGLETMELIARTRWQREVQRLHHGRYLVGVELVQAPQSYHRMVQRLAYH